MIAGYIPDTTEIESAGKVINKYSSISKEELDKNSL